MRRLLLPVLLAVVACGPEPRNDRDPRVADAGLVDAGETLEDAGGEEPDAGLEETDAGTCVPETDQAFCSRSGKTCNEFSGFDNCGASRVVASCGTCEDDFTCRSNVCVSDVCEPETDAVLCDQAGRACGELQVTDRCGTARTVASCGTCTSGTCQGGTCQACTPESNTQFCSRLGKDCGSVTALDNCGTARTTACGDCSGGETCGAAQANVCGSGTCTPESDLQFCARLGRNCGALTNFDNCGNARTVAFCGECTSPEKCGEGGKAGVCGCVSESDQAFCANKSKNCGTFTDLDRCNRSRTVDCGTCSGVNTCGAETPNVCGCASESDLVFCSRLGAECGRRTAQDNCGRSRTVDSCGLCTSPRTCGVVDANRCGCPETDAQICSRLDAACGQLSATNICGEARTVASCGSCDAPLSCGEVDANQCDCAPETDAQLCDAATLDCGLLWVTDRCATERLASCGVCAPPDGAGDLAGEQLGAAWPMDGFGPARQRRSPHRGPVSKPTRRWAFAPDISFGWAKGTAVGADGTIYLTTTGSLPSANRALFAVRPDGTQKWRYDVAGVLYNSPTIAPNGNVFFVTGSDKLECVTPQGSACAGFPVALDGPSTHAPLVGPDGAIYVMGEKWLRRFAANGTRGWLHEPFKGGGGTAAEPEGQLLATPALDDGVIYLATSKPPSLRAIDATMGAALRRFVISTSTTLRVEITPALSTDGRLAYVGAENGTLYAVRTEKHPVAAERGTRAWYYSTGRNIRGAPAVGSNGYVYFANTSGSLFALAPNLTPEADGRVRPATWSYSIGGGSTASEDPDYLDNPPIVDAAGNIYLFSLLGDLHGVSPSGQKLFEERLGRPRGDISLGVDGRLLVPYDDASRGDVLGAWGTR